MPTPLPAHHAALARRRYEVWIGHEFEVGRYAQDALGRFTSLEHAKAWIKEEHPDAEMVRITFYSERTGWRPQPIPREDWE